ncbi:MAG: SpaA isopeptide-forming pilin-related protein, partial [Bacteroidetes bacterium]|nr:SpaA isopeptide-forming pilin-related protein [Bacteroidota bacterium]
MKKLFVSLVILLIYSQLPAQTVWYFGNHASLDFTSGTPVSVANGQAINTGEGCTEAYDDKCNLLFYSDGITVWDKFNNIVVNGMNLQGSSTSTNSAIAVPVPGTNFENFYLFTVGDGSLLYNYVGVNGPRYSLLTNCKSTPVVDPVIKNVPLEPTRSSEKLAVTSDHNGGYWILAHGLTYLYGGGCYFYAYHLTNAGVLITTPVVSEIGTDHADVLANAQGQMKFSHDGSKVALAIMARRTVDLLNFNWNTGHLSSPKRVRFPDGSFYTGELDCQIYGIEFSQNNRFLYISGSYVTVGQPCKKRVYQVDLSNFAFDNNVNDYTTCGSTTMHETYFNSFSDINGLPGIRILYASPDNYYFQFGQMQYAPDGNIYLARKHITNPLQSNYLSRIENSNSVSATFNETAVSLLSGQANFEGLPFLLKDQNICPLSGITGFKYNDLDGDGVLDPKEPFLANWPINLTGDATKTTLTDANGHFTFDNLYAGTYTVSEPNVPGWVRTDPSFPSYTLTLGYNSTFLLGRAFGNHYREKCLYGYKFNDQNGNGVWDLGEPPVSGWEIHLIISNIYWTYTFTDANGFYLFDNFPDGPWYFVGETQQQGWNCTLPGQSSGYHIEPSALDNHVYYDFGNHKCINIPYDNMMGWWPMDELTGTTAKDIAGYNNEGTYHNTIEQVPGKVVAGLKFENTYPEFGSNNVDYVEIPDHPNLNFGESNPGIPGSGDFSIDTWFYYFQDQGETETIIAEKMNPSGTQGYSFFIRDGFLGLTLAAGTPVDFMSNVYIDAQYTWMHLAVTVDRDMSSDYGIRFYLDGNGYPGGNPVIVPESLTNDSPLKLGRRTVYERAFHILDEVELFNCVLTPEMVYSIYESDADGKCKPPVTVTISSVNPDHGVTIDVTPPDVSNKLGKGVTDAANTFKRYYLPNTSIYLKAPLSVGYWYYYFQKWMKNGADYVLYPNCNTGALITEDVNYTAVYHDCSVLGPVVGFETMKVCHGNIYIPVMSMHLDSIASLSFSFTLDTTELHFIGYQDCILDTVHGAFYMNEVGNTVFGAWYSLAPYSVDSGRMFTMVFEAAAGTHDLKWNLTGPGQCMVTDYDENIIPAIFLDGVLEVNRCSGVEGTLTYDNAVSTPLNNSLVLLKENGVVVKQDTTDAGGNYLMPDVFEGVYT